MAIASVDLGGTNIHAALGEASGKILAERQIPTEAHFGPAAVLDRIATVVKDLGTPESLGIGVPGLADIANGSTLFLPNLATQWRGVPVAQTLRDRLGCDVFLLNDARMAALGELDFGHGKQTRDFIFITLGTGVGGGVVLDGRLRTGPWGAAGELGHQTILPDGPPCGCGSQGCLESLVSASALTAEAIRLIKVGNAPGLLALADNDLNLVSPKLMAQCDDPAIALVIDRAARYLGIGIANLVTMLHPSLIVLGGGLAEMGAKLFAPVRAEVQSRVRMFPIEDLRIEASLAGPRAGILGGLALAHRKGVL